MNPADAPANLVSYAIVFFGTLVVARREKTYTGSVVINFGSIAAQSGAVDTTLTHADAQIGDVFIVSNDVITGGIIYEAYCETAGVITVRAINFSSGSVDPASTTFRVIGFKQ